MTMAERRTINFTDRLKAAGIIPNTPEPVHYDGPALPPGTAAGSRYAQRALEEECAIIATAPEGTRNDTLNRSAWKIGTLVASGHLGGRGAVDALTNAARQAGLDEQEIAGTVPRAVRQGDRAPRVVPQRPELPGAFTIDPADLTEHQRTTVAAADAEPLFIPGGTFVLDVPDTIPAIWGADQDILWADGESLIIAAGNGLGKTTIAGQLVRGRLGMATTVLGLPINPGNKKVLYLAMDRPQQIRRSLRRHFTDAERAQLDERLTVWQGPPPEDLAHNTDLLDQLVQLAGADTVVIDSLKDAAIGLSEDAVGAGWNRARQKVIARGCQVLELHHNVKRGANGSEPSSIADVFGSAWITAGVGSVILLTGDPGDPIVQMRHVKQPANEVGPWKVIHDHDAGISTVHEQIDIVEWLRGHELSTAKEVAVAIFDKENPSVAEKEKARRRLERLVTSGAVTAVRGAGSRNRYDPDRYDVPAAATSYWEDQ